MFKGFKKSTSNSSQDSQKTQDSNSLNAEKAMRQLECKQSDLERIIEKYCEKLEQLDKQCKRYISDGKKSAAKGCIMEMQTLKKQISQYHQKVNIIIQMKIKLETISQDQDLSLVMEQATSLFKNSQDVNDQLTESLQNWQEFLETQKETDDIFQEMENKFIDKQEIEDTLNQYEQEIQSEKLRQKLDTVPSQKIQPLQNCQVNRQIQVTNAKVELLLN
ncbi:unnamed protein product (macronuclear) [Paramecium tetraurelia]|uniref:Uncharacterized protein n=1 Tax=Paramecium tetraurelia TaxID=5888 RepID=A0D342_PARTE|nr:uncharacterized protein GSPATT00012944001 [Paramecium tetraurelia]CAK77459.1 unnamed protein product [Paramecium tetraurelia]|eukprot:XP_001444856.1 hypothetical protein (macronuclear) [Paramecium tetraurelia strain d4-2]